MSDEIVAVRRLALKKQLHNLYALFVVGAGAVVLALPMLIYGPYPLGQDLAEHLIYNRYFSQQFWAGEWYPRWLMDINHGLGSPAFFVYPPFQAYVYALLQPVTNAFRLNTLVAEQFLVLLASGVCAFLWLKTFTGRQIAVAGAVLYMLAPYHLNIDFYVRDALPECWALVWIPLLLYFTRRIMDRKCWAATLFAATYALLTLSHLISALIISFVPIAAVLVLSAKGEKLRSARGVAIGMFLGAGLSSFYLLPALHNARNFPAERLIPVPSLVLNDLLIGGRGIFVQGFFRAAALAGLDAIVVCFVFGIAVFLNGVRDSKRNVTFWLAVCAVPAFMLCGISSPVWRSWPVLLSAVQYPFRLNIVLCLAEVAIVAVFLSQESWTNNFPAGIRVALIVFIFAPWVFSYWVVWKDYWQLADPRAAMVVQAQEQFGEDGWFSSWTVSGLDQASALHASTEPRARFTTGAGTAQIVTWTPRHIVFETNSSTGGQVMLNQFYYPSWQAAVVSSAQPLDTKPAMPQGLVEVQVPTGQTDVRLDMPLEMAERIGRWISGLCVFLCAFLAWNECSGWLCLT